jgi:FkbM family methyltransferase
LAESPFPSDRPRRWLPPKVGRTRFMRLATRLGHDRLLALESLRRRNPAVRGLLAPLRWWLRRGSVRVTGGLGFGLRLSLAHLPVSHAHAGALPRGWLEVSVQEAFRRRLGEGDVLYDVGANIGFFALMGSRLVGAGGRVYAFEPAPANVAAIRENIALNAIANTEVVDAAVGAEPGRERLLLVDDASWSRLESQGWHPRTEQALEVEVITIDELVASGRARPPSVVKLDVEGSEIDVLNGMRRTIAEHRPTIVCELHGTHAEFVKLMDEVGYRTSNLESSRPVGEAGASAHAIAEPLA